MPGLWPSSPGSNALRRKRPNTQLSTSLSQGTQPPGRASGAATGLSLCSWTIRGLIHVNWPASGVTQPSDAKHMSTEAERKSQAQASPDSVTIQRREKGLQTPLSPFLCLSQVLPTMGRLFLFFPETALAVQQGQQKKKSSFSLQGASGSKNL